MKTNSERATSESDRDSLNLSPTTSFGSAGLTRDYASAGPLTPTTSRGSLGSSDKDSGRLTPTASAPAGSVMRPRHLTDDRKHQMSMIARMNPQ